MNHFTVDRKLELMRQIRSRYQRDRYDMFHRERLLYGKTSAYAPEAEEPEGWEDAGENFGTFPLRALLALGLFLLIIICDMSDRSFLGIQAAQCFSAISTEYESDIAAWVEAASGQGVSDADITNENPPAGSRP